MHSPLPDASALEAGILEDETPSRLSRVQDNVRNLLRTSRFGSVHSSPLASPTRPPNFTRGMPTPPDSPIRRTQQHPDYPPFQFTESTPSTTTSSPPSEAGQVPGVLFPPASYRHVVQQMAHQSALLNTRAVAALNHPDLSDPSLAVYAHHKSDSRRQRGWKRSRHGRKRHVAASAGSSQCLLCVLAALLLSAIVATYVVLATTSGEVTATFHVLFILGILLATIVFAHTLLRIFLVPSNSRVAGRKVFVIPVVRTRHRRHQREQPQQIHPPRIMPVQPSEAVAFVPPTPIPVHMPADEVRPDTREAQPTATAHVELSPDNWDKDVESLPNPPPAYGRWRGSVRANPDLLHWQVVPSPVDSDAPELPSPTYEEAMLHAQRTGPPSYVTRESPARHAEVRDAPEENDGAGARIQSVHPEMVEGRGIGLGV